MYVAVNQAVLLIKPGLLWSGKVRETQKFVKDQENLGNFVSDQGISKSLLKSEGILSPGCYKLFHYIFSYTVVQAI